MITLDRFVCSSQTKALWLEERAKGVTATQVAKASTKAGFEAVIANMANPEPVYVTPAMQWGVEREAHIAHVIKEQYGVLPNDWLISNNVWAWHLATPDGLSLEHEVIGEYKTSSKPLDKIPAHYMRQIQWQLHVTGAFRCVFAYELRLETPDGFVPSFDVKSQVVLRNREMIKELIKTAERLQEHAVNLDAAKALEH